MTELEQRVVTFNLGEAIDKLDKAMTVLVRRDQASFEALAGAWQIIQQELERVADRSE